MGKQRCLRTKDSDRGATVNSLVGAAGGANVTVCEGKPRCTQLKERSLVPVLRVVVWPEGC